MKTENFELSEAAKLARREYKRKWNRLNRDKVKAAQNRYWEKIALMGKEVELTDKIGWISVDERLPETYKREWHVGDEEIVDYASAPVLVFVQRDDGTEFFDVAIYVDDKKTGFQFWENRYADISNIDDVFVTHWMKLPLPPLAKLAEETAEDGAR